MTVQIVTSLPEFIDAQTKPASNASTQTKSASSNPTTIFARDTSTPTLDEQAVLKLKIERVHLYFRPELPTGHVPSRGDLYITDSAVYFKDGMTNDVFVVDYPSILIHAISRGDQEKREDEESVLPMVYCQLDGFGPNLDSNGDEIDVGQCDFEGGDGLFEMEIIPDESSKGNTLNLLIYLWAGDIH